MGVPLEEMDAVFGEGTLCNCEGIYRRTADMLYVEEMEEQLDNDSERASLVASTLPTNHQAIRPLPKRPNPSPGRGWVSRLMGRTNSHVSYEPIRDAEE